MDAKETPLRTAIRKAGGITALARLVHASSRQAVQQWTKTRVPAEYCPLIEEVTSVPCEALRTCSKSPSHEMLGG